MLNVIKDMLLEKNVSLAENIVYSALFGIFFVEFALLLWNHLRYGNEDNTVWRNRRDTIDYLLIAGLAGCLLSFALLINFPNLFPQNLFEAGVLIAFWLFVIFLAVAFVVKKKHRDVEKEDAENRSLEQAWQQEKEREKIREAALEALVQREIREHEDEYTLEEEKNGTFNFNVVEVNRPSKNP